MCVLPPRKRHASMPAKREGVLRAKQVDGALSLREPFLRSRTARRAFCPLIFLHGHELRRGPAPRPCQAGRPAVGGQSDQIFRLGLPVAATAESVSKQDIDHAQVTCGAGLAEQLLRIRIEQNRHLHVPGRFCRRWGGLAGVRPGPSACTSAVHWGDQRSCFSWAIASSSALAGPRGTCSACDGDSIRQGLQSLGIAEGVSAPEGEMRDADDVFSVCARR